MKRKLLIVASVFLTQLAVAQQRSSYTQYILNNYILNPALSGIENYTDVKISARDQWVGFSNGAPRTVYLTIQGPIGKKDYKTSATSFNIPGENPRGNSYWENYTASEPHHGVGFTVLNDKTGNYNRFTTYATYAYHVGLNARTNLSAGFSAGISVVGLNADGKAFFGPQQSDPAFSAVSGEINKVKPDLGVGLWLYSANYFVGISAQQVIPQKLAFVDDASFAVPGKLVPHIFLTGGVRFMLNDDFNVIPSVMAKYITGAFKDNYQVEGNVKLQYQDLVWIGASIRQFDGYAAMVGVNVANTFNVGYAYDYTKTNLNNYSRGTHEIMIGFLLGNRYGDTCPRNVW